MKKIFVMAGAVIIFTSCNQKPTTSSTSETAATKTTETSSSAAPKGQYEFKSGILEAETIMPGGMGTTTMKITFDDYGKLKVTETNMAMSMGGHHMNTTSKSLVKDDYIYSWSSASKAGMKFKMDPSRMDPKKDMDFSKMTDEMKAKLHMQEVGNETIDGKDCKVFTYEAETMKGKMWIWKQLPLQSEMTISGKTITTKYKSFRENPSIPAGTFDVPSDIEFKEMNLPATASK
ncbi:MAG: hypothetical protein JWN78_1460 [Bacteroidota bacterium]|nr:hypothetical protein [Bacteroidota bacterium]